MGLFQAQICVCTWGPFWAHVWLGVRGLFRAHVQFGVKCPFWIWVWVRSLFLVRLGSGVSLDSGVVQSKESVLDSGLVQDQGDQGSVLGLDRVGWDRIRCPF